MRGLSKHLRDLFRKRGTCEEHFCPRPCYDCMWAGAFFLETALRQSEAVRKEIVSSLVEKKKKKIPGSKLLTDQELALYREELKVKQSMLGYDEMMAVARTLLSHIDALKEVAR